MAKNGAGNSENTGIGYKRPPKNHQFKKGQTGNPNGRPKKLPDLDILMAEILGEEKDGKSAALAILSAMRAKASRGDIKAAELLLDRAYGKARQRMEHTGKDGEQLTTPLSDSQVDKIIDVLRQTKPKQNAAKRR